MNKQDRLQEFLRRMAIAPAAHDHDSALHLLSSTLDGVEDEFTNIPNNPDTWSTDGRMYPPQLDSARSVKGFPGVTRYRSRSHNTYLGNNGAIEIQDPDRNHQGTVHFSKNGANGRGVWEP